MQQLWNTALENTGVPIRMGEPMSRHTTFRIGGPAEYFAMPTTPDEVARLLAVCREQNIWYFVLGRGSNLLVGDRGIPGVVIAMEGLSRVTVEGENITAQAGATLSAVCLAARQAGLTGLEFAYGIPGQVGGGVYMNAGAYGGELKDVLAWVEALDETGKPHTITAENLEMSYRHSCFSGKGWVVLSAGFRLKTDPAGPDAVGARMEEILQRRKDKQPLEWPSAGSTFKRPEGAYAAALIDQCGLKGLRVGGAQVSEKHAGFVINVREATCADVLELIKKVQDIVKEKTGFVLEPEIRVTGGNT